jgi:hypothetical protein
VFKISLIFIVLVRQRKMHKQKNFMFKITEYAVFTFSENDLRRKRHANPSISEDQLSCQHIQRILSVSKVTFFLGRIPINTLYHDSHEIHSISVTMLSFFSKGCGSCRAGQPTSLYCVLSPVHRHMLAHQVHSALVIKGVELVRF